MALLSFGKKSTGGGGGGGVASVAAENGLTLSGTGANPVVKLGGELTQQDTTISGETETGELYLTLYNNPNSHYVDIYTAIAESYFSGIFSEARPDQSTVEIYAGDNDFNNRIIIRPSNILIKSENILTIDIASKGVGKILTSDASGHATWETPSGGNPAWELLGNAGTNSATNFLGTTDAQKLVIKTNNARRLEVSADYSALNFVGNSVNINGGAAGLSAILQSIFIGTEGNEAASGSTGLNRTVAIGANALKTANAGTTGQWVAVGHGSAATAVGIRCIAIGYNAASANNGNDNTIIGANSYTTGIGSGNTVMGSDAGQWAGLGGLSTNFCTLVGYRAGYQASNNIACVGIGSFALARAAGTANNIAVGHNALQSGLTGTHNVAIGGDAGYRLTGGGRNIMVGNDAGAYLTTGNRNVILTINQDGWQNSVRDAANDNVVAGFMAGWEGITGNWNVIFGSKAGNYESFGQRISGHKNVCIGANTNGLNAGATCNIIIGHGATNPVSNGNRNLNIGNVIYGKNMNDTDLPNSTEIADGCIGIGLKIPAARLHLPAGTATLAPLKLNSGVAPTAPADGEIWFDGTDLKMRVGGVTKTFTLV